MGRWGGAWRGAGWRRAQLRGRGLPWELMLQQGPTRGPLGACQDAARGLTAPRGGVGWGNTRRLLLLLLLQL
jgi:hypothetical protein